MTDHPGIQLVRDGRLAHVTLDRPDRLNTIDLGLAMSLLAVALDLAHDDSVGAVLLDGLGRSFCGGGDLKAFAAESGHLPQHLREVTANLHAALSILARLDAPLVVAAHGGVAGAGIGLMCLGDIVIAADDAKFVFAYNAIGLSPDGGTSWLLPRLIGPRHAMDLALTNRPVPAAEALEMGLVSRVVPTEDLAATTVEIARQLASGPTASYGATKRLFHDTWSRSFEQQLAAESDTIAALARGADGVEGMTAFLERRPPAFHGY